MSEIPTEPGTYWAREVRLGLGRSRMLGWPRQVEVVAGVPNPLNHRLLVKTGHDQPRYRGFDCYEFGPPTEREKSFMRDLASQP